MRILAVSVALFAMGCAGTRAVTSAEPRFSPNAFRELLNDPESLYAARRLTIGVPRSVWLADATAAWQRAYNANDAGHAGKIAAQFTLGAAAMQKSYDLARRTNSWADAIDIACALDNDVSRQQSLVAEVMTRAATLPQEAVYRLHYARCPLTSPQASTIIALAMRNLREDLVSDLIRVNVRSIEARRALVTRILHTGKRSRAIPGGATNATACILGLAVGARIGFTDADFAAVIDRHSCRDARDLKPLAKDRLSPAASRAIFDAAMKAGNFRLALFVFHAARGTMQDADRMLIAAFVNKREDQITDAYETRQGYDDDGKKIIYVVSAPVLDYPEHREMIRGRAVLQALRLGHVKLAAMIDASEAVLRRAFNRAIELGKFEAAAKIAEMDRSDGWLAGQGPLEGFFAAMNAKNFASGNRLRIRYKIPYAVYFEKLELVRRAGRVSKK